jgi:beta-lactamase superfamily II metal-dependent hydrolase
MNFSLKTSLLRQKLVPKMTSSKIAILDVGHGNCAVVIDRGGTSIIDAGLGGTLLDFLHENKVNQVEYVLISHADTDHIGGLIGLLAADDISVREVYLNPDPVRTSKIWEDLKSVLKEARSKRGTVVKNGLSTTIPGEMNTGDILIRVMAPAPELALSGIGGTLATGARVSAHTLNAVILVLYEGTGIALFPGDLDETGLDELRAEQRDMRAKVLVFPHHGGLPGKDPSAFARLLCELVKPETVVFSIGRGRHQTPRPEVVSAIRSASPGTHIACTQLSDRCAATLPTPIPSHLSSEVALGREKNQCCAGTLVIHPLPSRPTRVDHAAFITIAAPTAVCKEEVGDSSRGRSAKR